MKEVFIQIYREYYQASVALEEEIEKYIDNGYDDIKGEIALIDNNWRVGIIVGTRQFELDI
mgnify:CR=1 FL=1